MSQHIEQFISDCKKKGLSVTYQRLAVFKSLTSNPSHPTAEDIYNQVKAEHPTISLATVYKNLEVLARNNIISKVTPLHDLARFDIDTGLHHHAVCIKCRNIIDIPDDGFDSLSIPIRISSGFEVKNYKIQFEGICNSCSKLNH
jgi:Fur family transcriptional regulator, peroxide stress response regulator